MPQAMLGELIPPSQGVVLLSEELAAPRRSVGDEVEQHAWETAVEGDHILCADGVVEGVGCHRGQLARAVHELTAERST